MNFYPDGPRTTFGRLPGGIAGTRATLELMSRLVLRWKLDPGVRVLALDLVHGCAQQDYSCEVRSLHRFVRDQIAYRGDIADVETLQTPRVTLERAAGDCDDKTSLLATLLETINHKTRFVAGAFSDPETFSHVWLETRLGANWYPLDATKNVPAGWSPPGVLRRMIWHN